LTVDLHQDLFCIAYDPERVTPGRMLEAVRSKGFEGELVKEGSLAPPAVRQVRRDFGRLPAVLERAVAEARKVNKPLLVAFHGAGCPPCERMDAATYPDTGVQEELARWMLVRVDVSEHRELADLFEVAGIPVAVAVTGAGEELGRIESFVEPAVFRKRLAKLHPKPR
jgi:thiol:disulfide interchange protein